MRPHDSEAYNDSYAVQKRFRGIPHLLPGGRNLQYWAAQIRPLVNPVPLFSPQLLLHNMALSASKHTVLAELIENDALLASDQGTHESRETQARVGLSQVMRAIDAQIGTPKQIRSERFKRFWKCTHDPGNTHNKGWGLYVSQMHSLYSAVAHTLSVETFLDRMVAIINVQYQQGTYQTLVDIIQGEILRWDPSPHTLLRIIQQIIRLGKNFERVRTLPLDRSRRRTTLGLREPHTQESNGGRHSRTAHPFSERARVRFDPSPRIYTTSPHPVETPTQEQDDHNFDEQRPKEDVPLAAVCWRCCYEPDDAKEKICAPHNTTANMLDLCPLSESFRSRFPDKHRKFVERHQLSKADVGFAIRHQNRIAQFKKNNTDGRGRPRLEVNRPARTAVTRPQTLFRPPHAVPNGQTMRRSGPPESSHIFTTAAVSIEETPPDKESTPTCRITPTMFTYFPPIDTNDVNNTMDRLALFSGDGDTISSPERPLGPASTGLPDCLWLKVGFPGAYCNVIGILDTGSVSVIISEPLYHKLLSIKGVRTDTRPAAFLKQAGQFKGLHRSQRCKIVHFVVIGMQLGPHWLFVKAAVVRASSVAFCLGTGGADNEIAKRLAPVIWFTKGGAKYVRMRGLPDSPAIPLISR